MRWIYQLSEFVHSASEATTRTKTKTRGTSGSLKATTRQPFKGDEMHLLCDLGTAKDHLCAQLMAHVLSCMPLDTFPAIVKAWVDSKLAHHTRHVPFSSLGNTISYGRWLYASRPVL